MVMELPGGNGSCNSKVAPHTDSVTKLQNERQGFLDAFESMNNIFDLIIWRIIYD